MRPPYNLTGKKFGKLTAIVSPKKGYWRCICECGNESITRTTNLTKNHTKSCGCLKSKQSKSKKNIKRLHNGNNRAGKRKCCRCKNIWKREKGDSSRICSICKTKCSRCNVTLTEKNKDNTSNKRNQYICKNCVAELVRETRGNAGFKQRDYDLLRHYGITASEYELLLEEQHGKCYICLKEPINNKLSVDHKHLPGEKRNESSESQRSRVRGLLCWRCNSGLGKYGDDPNKLRRAAEYLENPPAQPILIKARLNKIKEQEENK